MAELMSTPIDNSVNLKAFPSIGAFRNEIGAGNSPGGIGLVYPNQIPLSYWWSFGLKKSKRSKRSRSRKNVLKNKRSKGPKRSKKFKDYLQKKIKKNIKEYKKGRYSSIKQALAVSYSQANKKFKI